MSEVVERLRVMSREGLLDAAQLPGFKVVSYDEAADHIEAIEAENARLKEALTPSGDTKAYYSGEFTIAVERDVNEDYEPEDDGKVDPYQHIMVPWTTIKQIMAAIRARAALMTPADATPKGEEARP